MEMMVDKWCVRLTELPHSFWGMCLVFLQLIILSTSDG